MIKVNLMLFLVVLSLLCSAQTSKKLSQKTFKSYVFVIQNNDTIQVVTGKELSSFDPIRLFWKTDTSQQVDSVMVMIANWATRILEKRYKIPESQNWIDIDLKEFGEAEATTRFPLKDKYSRMLFEIFNSDSNGKKLRSEVWTLPFSKRYSS